MSREMLLSLGGVVMVLVAIMVAMFPSKFGVGNDTIELIAYILGFGGAAGLLFYSIWTQSRRRKQGIKKR